MRLDVRHVTTYRFDPAMRGVVQSLRLSPARFDGQKVLHWSVDVPGAMRGAAFRDGAGDWVEMVSLLGPVEDLTVEVSGTVETADLAGVLRGHRERVPPAAYLRATHATRADVAVRALVDEAGGEGDGPLDCAHRLAAAVAGAIAFEPGLTEHGTTAAEALALGRGVCQDHAQVLIAAARHAGLPARYVCGYLHATDDSGPHEASHAWAELHVAGLGWVGFDAANACCPDERYVRLGSGRDAADAAPIRGVARGRGAEAMEVAVAVAEAAQ